MGEELRDYLTAKELEQLDSLIRKAEERRKEEGKEEADVSGHCFLMLKCQCERGKCMADEESMKIDLKDDLEKVLQKICQFCKSQGSFVCCKDEHTSGDEELPFES